MKNLLLTSARLTVQSCTSRHVVNLGRQTKPGCYAPVPSLPMNTIALNQSSTQCKRPPLPNQQPTVTVDQPQQAADSCLLSSICTNQLIPFLTCLYLYAACLLPLQLMCDACHAMQDLGCQRTHPQTILMQLCHACRLHWMPAKA